MNRALFIFIFFALSSSRTSLQPDRHRRLSSGHCHQQLRPTTPIPMVPFSGDGSFQFKSCHGQPLSLLSRLTLVSRVAASMPSRSRDQACYQSPPVNASQPPACFQRRQQQPVSRRLWRCCSRLAMERAQARYFHLPLSLSLSFSASLSLLLSLLCFLTNS